MAHAWRPANRLKMYRLERGWSQAEVAQRAGISRAAVSAIEVNRLVPSVTAALSLAAAFGCTVEDLFGSGTDAAAEPMWAWSSVQSPCRYWHAQVQGRIVYYPVEASAAGQVAHDGVFNRGMFRRSSKSDPSTTLVLACCDPAVALLCAEYARITGFRLLPLTRPSRQALSLLARGLVHVAGIHLATREQPEANKRAVAETLGGDYRLLLVARWEEGLCVGAGIHVSSVGGAMRAKLRWVGREPGSAARQCLDELLSSRPSPKRNAFDHRGVAEAVRSGWADIGVCHRLAADEAGLRFFTIREENFDLCYAANAEEDPRIRALLRTVRSPSYRRLLRELPGYKAAEVGEVLRGR